MTNKTRPSSQLAYGGETIEEKRVRIWRDCEPALRNALQEIQTWFDVEARKSIRSRWELGQLINAIFDEVESGRTRRYGVHAVEQIRDYFGWEWGKQVLYHASRLAKRFTEAEINELCEMRMPNGEPISYSHVMCLESITDPEKRKELCNKAVAGNWTTRELAKVVVEGNEPIKAKKNDRRGRPLAAPRHFDDLLAQFEGFADDFFSRASKVWEVQEHCLNTKMTNLDNADFTAERAAKVKKVARKLKQLSEKAGKLHQDTLQVYEGFLRMLQMLEAQKPQPKSLEELVKPGKSAEGSADDDEQ